MRNTVSDSMNGQNASLKSLIAVGHGVRVRAAEAERAHARVAAVVLEAEPLGDELRGEALRVQVRVSLAEVEVGRLGAVVPSASAASPLRRFAFLALTLVLLRFAAFPLCRFSQDTLSTIPMCVSGGDARFGAASARIVCRQHVMKPAMPAPPSRWPRLVFDVVTSREQCHALDVCIYIYIHNTYIYI